MQAKEHAGAVVRASLLRPQGPAHFLDLHHITQGAARAPSLPPSHLCTLGARRTRLEDGRLRYFGRRDACRLRSRLLQGRHALTPAGLSAGGSSNAQHDADLRPPVRLRLARDSGPQSQPHRAFEEGQVRRTGSKRNVNVTSSKASSICPLVCSSNELSGLRDVPLSILSHSALVLNSHTCPSATSKPLLNSIGGF